MGSDEGGDRDAGSPFGFLTGAFPMSLSQDALAPPHRELSIPVLKTDRLALRAPRQGDAKAIAQLANDRRIAVNTARIPHPYGLDDAEQFIAAVNRRDGQATFLIVLDGAPIGACGVHPQEDGSEIGYWIGVPYWGQGYATRRRARSSTMPSALCNAKRCRRVRASAIRLRAACSKSAASSGLACGSFASALSTRRRRPTVSVSIAGCGNRSDPGDG
jgi:hypothetical protein